MLLRDTLFYDDFDMEVFFDKYTSLQEQDATASLAVYAECHDRGQVLCYCVCITEL